MTVQPKDACIDCRGTTEARRFGWLALHPLKALGIVLFTAFAVEFGIDLLRQGFWLVTPVWPPVGVALAAFRWVGHRAWPWLVLGHCWVLFRLDPFSLWTLWLIPFLYPIEGWLAARWSGRQREVANGPDGSLLSSLCKHFLCPAAAVLPIMGLMACTLYFSGFSGRTMPSVVHAVTTIPGLWASLFLSHFLALITFGPLLTLFVRGDAGMILNFRSQGNAAAIGLGLIAMLFLVLGFAGFLSPAISPQALVMLPVPFLFLAAIWLNHPQSILLSTLACILSLFLSGMGRGPYGTSAGLTSGHIELGFYNVFLVMGMQTLSMASSNHLRTIRHRNLILEAAGMLPWRWTRRDGLLWGDGVRNTGNLHLETLCAPSGSSLFPREEDGGIPDRWNLRVDTPGAGTEVWNVVGRVLLRDAHGQPEDIIGLVKDASVEERARKAMLALQHQRTLMRGLQARLNPHFLFNSLNIIRALLHSDKARAEQAILNLAKLLRMTLKSSELPTIPLSAELSNICALMEIAEARFEERIRYQIRSPDSLGNIPVPAMLVFNLAENAITHGISRLEEGGTVGITATAAGGTLSIHITNTGTLAPDYQRGVGLSDALQRLELLYRGAASLTLKQAEPDLVSCHLSIPLES